MLGEVVFAAPAIFEAEAVGLGEFAHLAAEERVRGQQELACGELHDRAELDLVGRIGLRGPAITGGERQRDAVAMALDQLELHLELDILNEPAATFGYDSAERGGDHPPIGDAHLYFEIVALAER